MTARRTSQDLIRLLSYVDDPLAAAGNLAKNERRWLAQAEKLLRLEDGDMRDIFTEEQLRRAGRLPIAFQVAVDIPAGQR